MNRGRNHRLFFALQPNESVRTRVSAVQHDCGAQGRAVPPANFHVTLAFLGMQETDVIPRVCDVAAGLKSGIVLGCDTVAECDGQILGKPTDAEHARQMLQTLNGRQHRVFSGLCLWRIPDGEPRVRVAETLLRMDRLTESQLDEYLDSGQWESKAGGFGYQDRLGWVHVLEGSESNVVGLPMELLAEMMPQVGGHVPDA